MAGFTSAAGGVPFPRSAEEWVAKGRSPAEAEHKMREEVFGHDYTTDADGKPIERGKGSAAQQTGQHKNALLISEEARIARNMRLGWNPNLDGAFDPKQAEIDRLTAELAAAKKARRRAPGRKAKATTEAAVA